MAAGWPRRSSPRRSRRRGEHQAVNSLTAPLLGRRGRAARPSETWSTRRRPMKHETYWRSITAPTIAVPWLSVSCTWRGTAGSAMPVAGKATKTASIKVSRGKKADQREEVGSRRAAGSIAGSVLLEVPCRPRQTRSSAASIRGPSAGASGSVRDRSCAAVYLLPGGRRDAVMKGGARQLGVFAVPGLAGAHAKASCQTRSAHFR
jgi:hypothetical protein